MPLNKNIKKAMVIGSGPIVIGQAAEFDYAGTQACRALKEDGIEVVLVNSNPATIMTDNHMADRIYIEPLTLPVLKRIIEKEKPDSLLSTLGGQTGLTLSMQLAKDGFLEKQGVRLLGANPETIDKAEDRQMFKDTMQSIGQPVIPSKVVTNFRGCPGLRRGNRLPAYHPSRFHTRRVGRRHRRQYGTSSMKSQPTACGCHPSIRSSLSSLSRAGRKLSSRSCATRCQTSSPCAAMENFDPVGVHTGDSIVIAPAVTLSDKEYQMLRTAALDIINALKVEGGCNVQFALNP